MYCIFFNLSVTIFFNLSTNSVRKMSWRPWDGVVMIFICCQIISIFIDCLWFCLELSYYWGIPFIRDIMTSSNGNIFRVTGPFCREFTGHRWIPFTKPVTRSFDVSLICARISAWVHNRQVGDLRRHRAHNDVTVMILLWLSLLIHALTHCTFNKYVFVKKVPNGFSCL